MKAKVFMTMIVAISIAAGSCKSKEQREAEEYKNKIDQAVKENSPAKDDQQKTALGSFVLPEGTENIVGEWELVKVFADDNDNHAVDPEEEKDAITTMKDYLKLNANGTCEYTIAKLEGRYEIVTKEGRKRLAMYDRTGGETTSGRYIISVTKNELVINRIFGGSDFEVFKRL